MSKVVKLIWFRRMLRIRCGVHRAIFPQDSPMYQGSSLLIGNVKLFDRNLGLLSPVSASRISSVAGAALQGRGLGFKVSGLRV